MQVGDARPPNDLRGGKLPTRTIFTLHRFQPHLPPERSSLGRACRLHALVRQHADVGVIAFGKFVVSPPCRTLLAKRSAKIREPTRTIFSGSFLGIIPGS